MLVPEHEFALIILTNAESGWPAVQNMRSWAYRRYFGLEMPHPEAIESTDDDLNPYVGSYHNPFADAVLSFRDGNLVGELIYKGSYPTQDSPPIPSPPPFTLQLCAEDQLMVVDGSMQGMTIDMIRREDGTIGWMHFFARISVREA